MQAVYHVTSTLSAKKGKCCMNKASRRNPLPFSFDLYEVENRWASHPVQFRFRKQAKVAMTAVPKGRASNRLEVHNVTIYPESGDFPRDRGSRKEIIQALKDMLGSHTGLDIDRFRWDIVDVEGSS
jgi:hypothetical protein